MARERTSIYLLPETVALAIWVIIYTIISTLCALFTHILFRLNKQKAAYVSLTCIAIFLQQLITIIQQLIAIARWPEIQRQVWAWDVQMWGNPHASTVFVSNPDKWLTVTFQIRVYFFNVESLLFFFWSFLLFTSVWGIRWPWVRNLKFIAVSKYFIFIFPGLVSIIINLPETRKHAIAHLILMDFIMVITISCGIIFLLLILTKIVLVALEGHRSRRRQRIRVQDDRPLHKSSKEDKWIILRFIAGFLIIGALQASFLYSQYEYANHVFTLRNQNSPFPELGWTKKKQLGDWAYYMAGSSTGFLIILIFGTTPDSRTQAKRLLRRWFRCGRFGRRQGKPQIQPSFDVEKSTEVNGAGDTKIVFSSCNVQELVVGEPSYHDSFSGSHSSIIYLMQAPTAVALTPTLHLYNQNSRLSRPPTDTMFPEVIPIDDTFLPMAYRSTGTAYENEYRRESGISVDDAASTEGKRERDVVISAYDYRKDGLGRNGMLLRHCVSPLTPEVPTFEQFQIQQQPVQEGQAEMSHYPVRPYC
ncbi:hypothetical protein L211DRAFT_201204 [Terfezia boudieri ATCC MYA-4762]|uniref:Uncharacterized protein n=1 Tax=Terfezia boudieri ATCC MYA-4762 TaxID=1051890 RepID=A0A3N4LR53_9PEZI|nr:hypothetical protein L211DRAFT_201204 [Terfezia boudieri ATCC MYA-4762]